MGLFYNLSVAWSKKLFLEMLKGLYIFYDVYIKLLLNAMV